MSAHPSTLYSETVLAHNRTPRHCGCLADATHRGAAENALCGDQLDFALRVRNDRVEAAMFDGEACAIATASASMLADALHGAPIATVAAIAAELHTMFAGGAPARGDFAAFAELRHHPARQRCALLPLHAASQALAGAAA
ncbi:MAG: SUF system NifU family Fe-S cluster assembly protein [Xanthomonadales bacterium]|nr:SUF system NifU family Fe-S cluster assembly protein [Xanthomonadales bacterium]